MVLNVKINFFFVYFNFFLPFIFHLNSVLTFVWHSFCFLPFNIVAAEDRGLHEEREEIDSSFSCKHFELAAEQRNKATEVLFKINFTRKYGNKFKRKFYIVNS